MAKGDIYLGETGSEVLLSPFGRKFTIKDSHPVIREGRTSNGRFVRDIGGSIKKQFTLEYSEIDNSDLESLLTIIGIEDELSLIVYTGTSSHDHYTVLIRPVDRQRIIFDLWGGVSVILDEV
jgi:hypothetical protein